MNASEIIDTIQSNLNRYNYFGLRAVTPNYYSDSDVSLKVGDVPANSYHWIDGESTGVEINGVCAIDVTGCDDSGIKDALKALNSYAGKQIALIGSLSHEYGDDDGEVILRNNETVLAVWVR